MQENFQSRQLSITLRSRVVKKIYPGSFACWAIEGGGLQTVVWNIFMLVGKSYLEASM